MVFVKSFTLLVVGAVLLSAVLAEDEPAPLTGVNSGKNVAVTAVKSNEDLQTANSFGLGYAHFGFPYAHSYSYAAYPAYKVAYPAYAHYGYGHYPYGYAYGYGHHGYHHGYHGHGHHHGHY